MDKCKIVIKSKINTKVNLIYADSYYIVCMKGIKMTGSINSIGGAGASSSVASSSSSSAQKLTDETKRKLEELGVDTSSITTEAQGQIALMQAMQTQGGEKSGHGGGNKEEMESLKAEATSLAAQVGVAVSSDEKLSDIMDAIPQAISNLQAQAGTDEAKLSQVKAYQDEFDAISGSLNDMQAQKQASQAKLTGSLAGMAQSNQIYHKLPMS